MDEKQFERALTKEEMSYYATGLLWTKLIDVKAKQSWEAMTQEERALRKVTEEMEFNVPQPIESYLHQMGHFTDKMGKKTELDIQPLPITRVQGHGGYHAAVTDANTHNRFEEIPSLKIAGDMVMALCEDTPEPIPNFRMEKSANAVYSENLVRRKFLIGLRRPEIKQRLAGLGITSTTFPEYKQNTRFNIKYMMSSLDIVGKLSTFRTEKMYFARLTAAGGKPQVITRPTSEHQHLNWTTRSVQATSAADSTTATMGASFMFGFQTYKEPGDGAILTLQHAKWCCLTSEGANARVIPQERIQNRNVRRNLPPGVGTERFRTLSKRQDFARPLYVKGKPHLKKCYIALLTCTTIRAVHLEICGDSTTDTFLLAFQRFNCYVHTRALLLAFSALV